MTAKAKFRLEGEDATAAAFKQALAGAKGTADKMSGIFKAAFAGISIAGVTQLAARSIALGDELQKAAVKAGLSGRAISELAYAAKMADVDLGALSNSIRFMQTAISQASTGSKSAQEALRALGLTFSELRGVAADKQFEAIAERISRIRDASDRARAATELFGRAGADLLPLFEQGAEGIRKAREEAVKFGRSFDDIQLQKLAAADDSVKKLSLSFEGLATTLIAKASPALSNFFNDITATVNGDKIGKLRAQIEFLESQRDSMFTAPWKRDDFQRRIDQFKDELMTATRRGQPRRTHNRGATLMPSGGVPGFTAEDKSELSEVAVEAVHLFDRETARLFRDRKPIAIDAEDLVNVRYDQFGESLLENTEGIADRMSELFERPFNEVSTFADEAARNMQSAFADFLFDPFEDGMKGMLKSFVDIIRRMVAEIAAAQILGSKSEGGLGLADFITGGIGGIFGKGGGIGSGIVQGEHDWLKRLPQFPGSGIGGIFGRLGDLFGFQHGGSFKVAGAGGIDSQLVAFRATPGEQVTINPPGRSGASGAITVNNNVTISGSNTVTREEVIAAMTQASDVTVARLRDMRRRGTF